MKADDDDDDDDDVEEEEEEEEGEVLARDLSTKRQGG